MEAREIKEHWYNGTKGEGLQNARDISNAKETVHVEHGNMPQFAKDNPEKFWDYADQYEEQVQNKVGKPRVYTELRNINFAKDMTREEQVQTIRNYCDKELNGHAYTAAIQERNGQTSARIMFSPRKDDGIQRDPETYFKEAAKRSENRAMGGTPKGEKWRDSQAPAKAIRSWYREVERTKGRDDLGETKDELTELRNKKIRSKMNEKEFVERTSSFSKENSSYSQQREVPQREILAKVTEKIEEQNRRISHELSALEMEKRFGDTDIQMSESLKKEEAELRQREEDRRKTNRRPNDDIFDALLNGIADQIDQAIRDAARKMEAERQERERQRMLESLKLQAQVYVSGAKSPEEIAERCARVEKAFAQLDRRMEHMKGDTLKQRLDINKVVTDYKQLAVVAKECPDQHQKIDFSSFRRDYPGTLKMNIQNIRDLAREQQYKRHYEKNQDYSKGIQRDEDSYSRSR